MSFVITDACQSSKSTACVAVCPCDAIHPTKDEAAFADAKQLYIDPDSCIDCGLCADECPVKAIFADDDLPKDLAHFIQVNADWYNR